MKDNVIKMSGWIKRKKDWLVANQSNHGIDATNDNWQWFFLKWDANDDETTLYFVNFMILLCFLVWKLTNERQFD